MIVAGSLGLTHEVTPVKRYTSKNAFLNYSKKTLKTCMAMNFTFYGNPKLARDFHKSSRQDRLEADGLNFSTKRQ
jgi:hypothetical protein